MKWYPLLRWPVRNEGSDVLWGRHIVRGQPAPARRDAGYRLAGLRRLSSSRASVRSPADACERGARRTVARLFHSFPAVDTLSQTRYVRERVSQLEIGRILGKKSETEYRRFEVDTVVQEASVLSSPFDQTQLDDLRTESTPTFCCVVLLRNAMSVQIMDTGTVSVVFFQFRRLQLAVQRRIRSLERRLRPPVEGGRLDLFFFFGLVREVGGFTGFYCSLTGC